MADPLREEERKEEEFATTLAYVFTVAMLLAFLVLGLAWWNFRGRGLSSNLEEWGQFGDYVGGIVNPLFGFFSLFVLILALQLQRRTLRETRRQGVLEELQRFLSAAARDLDSALRQRIAADGDLHQVAVGSEPLGGLFEDSRDLSVSEVLRYALREMVAQSLPLVSFHRLANAPEALPVFRLLQRLDECLLEFQVRGGDPIIGKLYGTAYSDAARVLFLLHVAELSLDLDTRYGADALDRLGLRGHDQQTAIVRQHVDAEVIRFVAEKECREEELRDYKDRGAPP